MDRSDILPGIVALIFLAFVVVMIYTLVINTANAQASYEYGLKIGERFCNEHNGELEKVPKYMLRNTPTFEPYYIECKEVHDSKIEYNRYELVKGNYYLVVG